MGNNTFMTPGSRRTLPDPEECRKLLEKHRVPVHIRRHSEKVAAVTCRLAADLNLHTGKGLDLRLLEAAALLHDIVKLPSQEKRRDHAQEGGRLLRSIGLSEIAELVEQHVTLRTPGLPAKITEAELLNYGDKRVLHERIVSLAERFEDLIKRYGRGRRDLDEKIRKNWQVILGVEEKIFAELPFGPEALESW